MSIGSTLKEARERKGLTIAQVAEQTRMIHQLVEEIEQDDFHRITAALYGRGFIKLFAECVDEDPAPLMQEFTEIYTGLRRPGVRTRPVQTPVESPEVAEPKDRNAPPPRPKVRAVVVADDDADDGRDAPTARPGGRFVETSLPSAADIAQTSSGRDAPTARPGEPVESPKSKVESPAAAQTSSGRDAPTARPGEPVESPKSKVESPAADIAQTASGRDAPTARPSEPVESPKSKVVSPAADIAQTSSGRDAPTARPGEPVESLKSKVESPAADIAQTASGRDAPTARPGEPVESDEPKDDESFLGDLFDLVARKRARPSDEPPSDKREDKEESPVKISLPQPAPSWNDAPLEEEGAFWSILSRVNVKLAVAVLGGVVLLSAIVFGVVAKRHSKPEEANISQATPAPTPTSTSTPAPTPTPTPTPTLNSHSQLPPPSSEDAVAAPDDGRTVYTANLIPPPDSYVE